MNKVNYMNIFYTTILFEQEIKIFYLLTLWWLKNIYRTIITLKLVQYIDYVFLSINIIYFLIQLLLFRIK